MAKKLAKKKTAKKAAKKAPAKKAARKAPSKSARKKTNRKAAKKVVKKKVAAKKAAKVAQKGTKKKAKKVTKKAAKKVTRKVGGKKKTLPTKGAKKKAAGTTVEKKTTTRKKAVAKAAASADPAKKTAKKTTKTAKRPRKRAKTAVAPEDLPPVVVKRAYVRPEKLAKLNGFEKKQQRRLLELRDQITDVMYGIQNETIRHGSEGSDASGSGMHQGDAGSDAYDRDFALNMLSQEANALGEIEAALQRLETGMYGLCEESGAKIPRPRLEAIPFARLTVERQAAKEQESSTRDQSGAGYGFH